MKLWNFKVPINISLSKYVMILYNITVTKNYYSYYQGSV